MYVALVISTIGINLGADKKCDSYETETYL